MNCPICDEKLRTIDKMGVQIEICPQCKGIWLDRGELEKLMEMAAFQTERDDVPGGRFEAGVRQHPDTNRESRHDEHDNRSDHDDHDRHKSEYGEYNSAHGQRKKRGTWLSDILGSLGGDD